MTAHEHHTHPPEPYCCCGWGYPDPISSGQPVDDLPTWEEINQPAPSPCVHPTCTTPTSLDEWHHRPEYIAHRRTTAADLERERRDRLAGIWP